VFVEPWVLNRYHSVNEVGGHLLEGDLHTILVIEGGNKPSNMATPVEAATPATATAGAKSATVKRPATALSTPNLSRFPSVERTDLPDIDSRLPLDT